MAERDGRYTMPTDGLVDLMERIAKLEAENQRLRAGIEKLRDECVQGSGRLLDGPFTWFARRLTELLEDK